jgi:hypothetical protein
MDIDTQKILDAFEWLLFPLYPVPFEIHASALIKREKDRLVCSMSTSWVQLINIVNCFTGLIGNGQYH